MLHHAFQGDVWRAADRSNGTPRVLWLWWRPGLMRQQMSALWFASERKMEMGGRPNHPRIGNKAPPFGEVTARPPFFMMEAGSLGTARRAKVAELSPATSNLVRLARCWQAAVIPACAPH